MTWSHHQKFVSIDGRIAYVGGLDLTWGRYGRCSSSIALHCITWFGSLSSLLRFDDEHFHLFDPDSKTWLERDYGTLLVIFISAIANAALHFS